MVRYQRRVIAADTRWHVAHCIAASPLLRSVSGGAVDGERIVEMAFADRQLQIDNLRRIHIFSDDFSAKYVFNRINLLVPPVPEFMAPSDYAHTAVLDP